jgi:hypothetical protein
MKVRKKQVGDVFSLISQFEKAVMSPETVIEQNEIRTVMNEIPRAHSA